MQYAMICYGSKMLTFANVRACVIPSKTLMRVCAVSRDNHSRLFSAHIELSGIGGRGVLIGQGIKPRTARSRALHGHSRVAPLKRYWEPGGA
jgi:hypothetical protein